MCVGLSIFDICLFVCLFFPTYETYENLFLPWNIKGEW